MCKDIAIIIFTYLKPKDLVKMKSIEHVCNPLVWKNAVNICNEDITLFDLKDIPVSKLIYVSASHDKFCLNDILHIDDLKYICNTHLTSLNLSGTNMSNEGLKLLNMPHLKTLRLRYTNITDDGLRYIKHMNLDTLDVSYANITDVGIQHIVDMNLYELRLRKTYITNKSLQIIQNMNLKNLDLSLTKIANQGLAYLKHMPLQELDLSHTYITYDGIHHINTKYLKQIELYDTGICRFHMYLYSNMHPNIHTRPAITHQNLYRNARKCECLIE